MAELEIFENPTFGKVRTMEINGEPFLVGKDVAEILGYTNPRKALSDHVDSEDRGVMKCDTLGGMQEMTVINESGLYSLILSSKLPWARDFKRWVTSEVLPSIRRGSVRSTYISFSDYLSACEKTAEILRLSDVSKLEMLRQAFADFKLPVPVLPAYSLEENHVLLSASELLKRHNCIFSVQKFNAELEKLGLLETMERTRSNGHVKKFKSIVGEGLNYGKNVLCPKAVHETQPLWFADTFDDLLGKVKFSGV